MVSFKNIKQKLGRGNKGKNGEGFLVCEKCGGYYELQPGESQEDFVACECGGDLKHTKTFNIPSEATEDDQETITCPFCGMENEGHSKYCQDCGKEIST
ncbi:MAG: hypothetical protein A4E25_01881 [Methanobacterium sp. PtaB.Bin024]|jgi:hypothetical protein|nr:MAG: hypothetical protein A4E25_01881 [Methanobacterium sp. PtaB.Bin024]